MSVRRLNEAEFHDLAREILQTGHLLRFQASGGSMQPFIKDGDILEVAPFSWGRAGCGDVLLVEVGEGSLLAHRVIKTRHRDGKIAYLINGDACPHPDGWFGLEKILGRVVVVEHGRQHIRLTSRTQLWRARLWIIIAPWIQKFSWLPEGSRRYLRQLLFGV